MRYPKIADVTDAFVKRFSKKNILQEEGRVEQVRITLIVVNNPKPLFTQLLIRQNS